jgi:hypothetical protein
MTKIAGSGSESGSISQRHGSADPDSHQNVMDPEHCLSLPAYQAGPLDLLQGVQVGDLLVVDELVLLLGQLQLTHNDVTGVGQCL